MSRTQSWQKSTKFHEWQTKKQTSTSVGLTYIHSPHMPILYVHTLAERASLTWCLCRRISTAMFTCGWAWPARSPFRPIVAAITSLKFILCTGRLVGYIKRYLWDDNLYPLMGVVRVT